MGKIQRIHLKNMRNGVHYQFMDDVLRMAAGNGTVTGMCAARIAALKEAGKTYEAHVYPGTNHGFHNDSTPRYDPEAAELAWQRTLDWFARYLA